MATVDQGYAAWLKSEELVFATTPASAARWPTQGIRASSGSPFATEAGAAAEADRRAAFFGAPMVRERAVVAGEQRDLIGRCVTLQAAQLGYRAEGEPVFVIAVAEQQDGTSILTVLRRLT